MGQGPRALLHGALLRSPSAPRLQELGRIVDTYGRPWSEKG
jgi:hypothetical protein